MPPGQRRASIVEAAHALLVRRGITFTTREVAEAAGIAEGTVFRHFDTKDDLIGAVVDDVFDPGPLCREIDATPGDLDLPQAVQHALSLMQGHFESISAVMTSLHPRHRPPVPHRPHHGPPDDPHHGILAWHAAVTGSLTGLLNRYTDRLRLPVDQACILLMSVVLVDRGLAPIAGHRFSATELTDILLNGIAVAPEAPPGPDPYPSQTPSSSVLSQESPCS
ncbi:HTH-type transcriptional repressor [Acidipropionibacterium virtanenii]|uniref:HTH-type transcriptional repressor n=2 Tax=Acidipropionibacterium virtanenii TaxID=2057246 RepID=A0A344UXA3_9ACTN|nr:HTH-type transcriptional repressor [Acidipropionibacterium virtanenii]